MKTILFPTDFSENALHAVKYAGMLAIKLKANVVLLNVYPRPCLPPDAVMSNVKEYVFGNKNNAESKLADFTDLFLQSSKMAPENVFSLTSSGNVAENIVSKALEINADYIVMGTKGTSNFEKNWLGTNTHQVMNTANCPVWIIPQNSNIVLPKKALYLADLQEDEVVQTQKISNIMQPFNTKCKVVHIHKHFEMNVALGNEYKLTKLKDEFSYKDDSIKNLNHGDILDGLEVYIKNQRPHVLALGVNERSFVSKILNPEVTKQFAQQGNLPLVTFRKLN